MKNLYKIVMGYVLCVTAIIYVGLCPCMARNNISFLHIDINGENRLYELELRGRSNASGVFPILIELHGIGADIVNQKPSRYMPNFDEVSDLGGVAIVRPQGANRQWDVTPSGLDDWRRLSGTDGAFIDDLAFIRAIVTSLISDGIGDPNRVYLYGISNGGYMAARFACETRDVFAAVAILIATVHTDQLANCTTDSVVPVMILASTTDPVNPYGGDVRDGRRFLTSAPETSSFFAKRNGCRLRTETPLRDIDPEDGSAVTLVENTQCNKNADVLLYRIDGGITHFHPGYNTKQIPPPRG